MQLEEKKKLIEETTKEVLDKMGFKATVYIATNISSSEDYKEEDAPISVELELNDSKYLIGKHGVNLAALQHILRVLVRKKSDDSISFNLDVNGYREEQRQSIVNLAQEMGTKAKKEEKSVVLRPMNAYERRLVHLELSKIDGIRTESIGEGEERKVIIKPISISEELNL